MALLGSPRLKSGYFSTIFEHRPKIRTPKKRSKHTFGQNDHFLTQITTFDPLSETLDFTLLGPPRLKSGYFSTTFEYLPQIMDLKNGQKRQKLAKGAKIDDLPTKTYRLKYSLFS